MSILADRILQEFPADLSRFWIALDPDVFVERVWRSVKYEEVYLRAYDSVTLDIRPLGRVFRSR